MTTTKPRRWFGRTKLITIASIAAVGAAGAFAIGANIGILNAADNTDLGQLSAAGAATTPSTQVVDVYVNDPPGTGAAATSAAAVTATTAGDPTAAQQFAVDAAGTVAVVANGGSLRLDSVTPASGWTWSLAQTQPAQLTVTFTSGSRTLEFVAAIGPDGNVTASVNEPIVTPAATAAPSGGGHESSDGHEYEGGEDDD